MDKTSWLRWTIVRRHPLYHKRITKTSKFFAHDENNECKIGDLVRIEETPADLEERSAGSSAKSLSAC